MTIVQFVHEKGWQIECDAFPCKWMSVNVSFVNANGVDDETSFDIHAYDATELEELFRNFCKENGFPIDTVYNIVIVAMAESFQELEKTS